jgi:hypothetical protein
LVGVAEIRDSLFFELISHTRAKMEKNMNTLLCLLLLLLVGAYAVHRSDVVALLRALPDSNADFQEPTEEGESS